jgi:hypothetical protein
MLFIKQFVVFKLAICSAALVKSVGKGRRYSVSHSSPKSRLGAIGGMSRQVDANHGATAVVADFEYALVALNDHL